MNSHEWFAGITVDHLYVDCPNRIRSERSLREWGLWESGGLGIDALGTDVCGRCASRYVRIMRREAVSDQTRPHESLALTVALAQMRRGEPVSEDVATVCILALGRICSRVDYDGEEVRYSVPEPGSA